MLNEYDFYLEQPSRHFCQYFMRRTTQETLLFFSGKGTIQTFNGLISVSHYAVDCEVINL